MTLEEPTVFKYRSDSSAHYAGFRICPRADREDSSDESGSGGYGSGYDRGSDRGSGYSSGYSSGWGSDYRRSSGSSSGSGSGGERDIWALDIGTCVYEKAWNDALWARWGGSG